MSDYAIAQLMQKIENLIRIATVIERDGDRAKVDWGNDTPSAWLKIAQLGSEELKFWIPPSAGTQVVVISPGGDTTKGVIFPGPFAGGVPVGNFAGTITGAGDVIASEISLVEHVHGGVLSGQSNTKNPT
jgi:phage baseplate assembly protein gpV